MKNKNECSCNVADYQLLHMQITASTGGQSTGSLDQFTTDRLGNNQCLPLFYLPVCRVVAVFKVLAFKLVRTTTSWQMARCRKAVKWSIKSQWTIDQLDKERWKKVAFYYYYIVQIMFYLMFYVRPFLFSMNSLTDLKYLRSIKFQWWICVCFVTILMVCNYLPHSLMALLFPSPNWLLAAAPPALVHSWHSLHKH